ncbi:MAG: hypothetical protein QN141_05270 [Armatimonadota bacterium]|nr:hypothetical protein [Armatimonadota bacterium]MDR7466774.1 hypothetical protein [Armatimonadota bacterium]MDR7492753.1 hypothetical protein [Armatimonadota bacterium]MDR7498529.1 hypothetical protein [Armatimonadota bacterium]MDR7504308.1 hypothetical protein [Armatimonadota bacterium]
MAELWQAYGTWVLYGLFFLAFLWLHGFMHGGHGGHGGAHGRPARRGSPDAQRPHHSPPAAHSTDASSIDDHATSGPYHDHAPDQKAHTRRGGCC